MYQPEQYTSTSDTEQPPTEVEGEAGYSTGPPLLAIFDDAPKVVEPSPARRRGGQAAEAALFGLLTDAYSVEKVIEAGLTADLIPTDDLRPIYEWAIHQFEVTDNLYAPTPLMFEESDAPGHKKSWASVLKDYDIDIHHVPDESVEWVIEELRACKVRSKLTKMMLRMAEEVNGASASEMTDVALKGVGRLNDWADHLEGGSNGQVVGIPATEAMRAIRWLWDERLELRTLSLLAGRGGLGKSTIALDIAAKVSRGTLPGYYFGKPKGVVICATEDDWHSIIIPRLEAMGADRSKVFHSKVKNGENFTELTLPDNLDGLKKLVTDKDAALIILDPLLSRLSASLDSHKDAEVRRALEPLVKIAVDTKSAVLGIIHVNKSGSKDAMQSIMASAAFANVARSTLMTFKHPEDPNLKIFCPDKNNHAESGKGTMTYRTEEMYLGQDTDDGDDLPIKALKIVWGDADARSADEIVEALSKSPAKESKVELTKLWLKVLLADGGLLKPDVEAARRKNGTSDHTLRRAREELEEDGELETVRLPGKPPKVEWRLI